MKTTMFKVFAFVSILVLGFATVAAADTIKASEMTKADFLAAVFSGTPTVLNDGYGAAGATKSGVTFPIEAPVVSVNDGTEKTSGSYTTDGSTISVYFNTKDAWTIGGSDPKTYETVDISALTKVSEVVAAIADKESKDLEGGKVLVLKDGIKFVVSGIVTKVQDGTDYVEGDTVTCDGQTASVWMADKVEPVVIKAESLVTFDDVRKCDRFQVKADNEAGGSIQVSIAPNTTVEVYDSWAGLTVASGTILSGNSYTTGSAYEDGTFWVNEEYWEEKTSIKLTSSNLSNYLETTDTDGEWNTVVPTSAAEGMKLRTETTSDIIMLTKASDGTISDPDYVDTNTEEEIIVAKKSAVDNSNGSFFASVANMNSASPSEVTGDTAADGKVRAVFYAASNKLSLSGSNLYKIDWDLSKIGNQTRIQLQDANGNVVDTPKVATASVDDDGNVVDEDGNIVENPEAILAAASTNSFDGLYLVTIDSRPIGQATAYLFSKGSSGSNDGGSTGEGGGGGGGCSTSGLGIFGLLLALPILGKKRS